jgi:hypothetical protein
VRLIKTRGTNGNIVCRLWVLGSMHVLCTCQCSLVQLSSASLYHPWTATMLSSGKPTLGYSFARDNLLSTQPSELSLSQTPICNGRRSTNNRKGCPLVYARCRPLLLSKWLITSIKCKCDASLVHLGRPIVDDSSKSKGKIQRGTVAQSHRGAIVAPSKSMRGMIFPDSLSIYGRQQL